MFCDNMRIIRRAAIKFVMNTIQEGSDVGDRVKNNVTRPCELKCYQFRVVIMRALTRR